MAGGILILWAFGAILYDLPLPGIFKRIAAVLFLTVSVFFWSFGRGRMRAVAPGLVLLVAIWWLMQKPSNSRDWLPDVDRTAWAEINGDTVTLHNVRNCEYWTETDFSPRWEIRTVRPSRITGIDVAINYWGSELMSHPIVSFQFADAPPLCFSIETRKESTESYSAIGGIYRQYELIYVVAEEQDVIRLRTNYRKGEDVYLYRLNITPETARDRFMDYLKSLNQLHREPAWYNALTANCTTAIRTQHQGKRDPWDWRIIVNGKVDEMLYERGAIGDGSLPFKELKTASLINKEAMEANHSGDFSNRIRANAPTFKRK